MHEFHAAQKIIETIKKEMSKAKAKRLKGAKMSVGELSGIKPKSLKLYFEEYSKGTPMEDATFDIIERLASPEVVLLSIVTE